MSSAIRLFIKFTLGGGGGEFMNGSTQGEIKYMKGCFFFVYDSDWGWSENTDSHTHTKMTHKKDKV